jgi:hypothetical protein
VISFKKPVILKFFSETVHFEETILSEEREPPSLRIQGIPSQDCQGYLDP